MKKSLFLFVAISLLLLNIQCNKDCIKSDRCYLAPDPGICKAYMPKYYYDKKDKKCKEFIYGGCEGLVPFETLEECKKQCGCK